ncbi:MAG: pyridoxal-dependent decarboxylase [Bacteriovoracaceae bacterium]|jgi:glutamate/tyrosine decarboxylase-like PLP-dependent enzyme|nr:pyridoxal-dependent decarboxylase [Bacteriovoracaceae bacterium]
MNKENFWHELISLVEQYLKENQKKSTPVVNYLKGTEVRDHIDLSLNGRPGDYQSILDDVRSYMKYAVRTTHPQFNNQLYGGFSFPAFVGEIVSYITNTTMATYEVAPIASILEKELVKSLNDLIGFSHGEGIMVTGGSNANMLAIHLARSKAFEEVKQNGNSNKKFRIYVSDQAHYSFQKAVNLMGIGHSNLIAVKSNRDGIMCSSTLEELIQKDLAKSYTPLMIASTAGTTVLGAFDNILNNDIVAKKYSLWHHVDAAWGGPVLFSDKYDYLMKGIKDVDSVTWDSHKLMGSALVTSFILTKHVGALYQANSGGGTKYLFHDYENSEFDTGGMSLQCGRKVDALKMWLQWRHLGQDGYKELVERQYDKAMYMLSLVKEHPRLKLICEPRYLNLCFQVIPKRNDLDINQYNYDLRFALLRSGKSMVNFSRLKDGTIFFRFVFINNITTYKDIDQFVENLFEIDEKLYKD